MFRFLVAFFAFSSVALADFREFKAVPVNAELGVKLTRLRPDQAAYIGVPEDGPYKPDHYRY